ncbi:MAG: SRPBCC family protein [Bacteroidota bacterium]
MPKTFVSRSITINAPKEKVKNTLSDLHNWRPWSPWLVCEPEAKVDVEEDGRFYKWEGKRTGSGTIKVVQVSEDKIEYDLNFLKPWKSYAKVNFNFTELGDGQTKTEWTMASSLPFFMFWMKKKMEAWIGMDYDRGLRMLKEYIETGSIRSRMEFVGKHAFEGCKYIGIKRTTSFDKIGEVMQKDFGDLKAFVKSKGLDVNGFFFSQYHKFDMVSGSVIYTAGAPVAQIPDVLDAQFVSGDLPKAQFHTVRHHGAYDHLGNAWSASMMMMRNKEFKGVKNYHPVEIYRNDPEDTAPADLITDVSFAIK